MMRWLSLVLCLCLLSGCAGGPGGEDKPTLVLQPVKSPSSTQTTQGFTISVLNEAGIPADQVATAIQVWSEQANNDWSPAYGYQVSFVVGQPAPYRLHLVNGGGCYHNGNDAYDDVTRDPAEFTLGGSHEWIEMLVAALGFTYEGCDGLGWYNVGGPAGWPVSKFYLPNQSGVVTPSPLDATLQE